MDVDQPRLLPAVLAPEHAGSKRTTRDWVVDVVAIVTAGLIGVTVFSEAHTPNSFSDAFTFLDVIAGTLACLALWVRRRWPVGLTLALVPLAAVCSSAGGAALVALFTVAVHRPVGQAALLAGLALATQPIYLAIYPTETSYL